MKAKARIIFPLDGMGPSGAVCWAARLSGQVGLVKVGLELFVNAGPPIVEALIKMKVPVMLDLKLNDIPATMAGAAKRAVDMGVDLLTIHAGAGPEAAEACVRATEGTKTKIVAVTVLTSLDEDYFRYIYSLNRKTKNIPAIVSRMVSSMTIAGVNAYVCSPNEVSSVKSLQPQACVITPGIRPPGTNHYDQKRVNTPRGAIAKGSDFLVIGRPIREAEHHKEVISDICTWIEQGLEDRAT
jgi:orotidine-5'-phosphate decarboxylase